MKKFFYFVAVVATVMFSACGGKTSQKSVDTLPEDLQDFVFDMRDMIMHKLDTRETRFVDIVVEGNNLVCRFTFDEDETGMSLKKGFNYGYRGLSDEDVRLEFIRRVNQKCESTMYALREYRYNVVVRFTGSRSKYVKDINISYKDF